MFHWFRRRSPAPDPARLAAPPDPVLAALARLEARGDAHRDALEGLHAGLDHARAESAERGEALKKLARSHGRTALRVEEIEHKLDALVGGAESPAARHLDVIFDALDLLDRALESVDREAAPELARGLEGLHGRLARHLEVEGFARLAPRGGPVDGTALRVVGTVAGLDHPDGHVVTVVRAGIRHGARLVREGEVIIAKHVSPPITAVNE